METSGPAPLPAADQRTVVEADEAQIPRRLRLILARRKKRGKVRRQRAPAALGNPAVQPFQQTPVINGQQMRAIPLRRAVEKRLEKLVQQFVGAASLPGGGAVKVGQQGQAVLRRGLPHPLGGGQFVDAKGGGEPLQQGGFAIADIAAENDQPNGAVAEAHHQILLQRGGDVGFLGEITVQAPRLDVSVRGAGIHPQQAEQPRDMLLAAHSFRAGDEDRGDGLRRAGRSGNLRRRSVPVQPGQRLARL